MEIQKIIFCMLCSCVVIFLCENSYGFVIYGEDNREDTYVYKKKSTIHTLAQSIAAMIRLEKLKYDEENEIYHLKTKSLKELNYCKEERFYSQPSAASCTGFLVGEDLLATARHCLIARDCKSAHWVFNFEMLDEKNYKKKLSKEDIYQCVEIVEESDYWNWNQDYALLRLDRPVKGRFPLSIRKEGELQGDEELFTIGHPLGLPKKTTGKGSVLKNDHYDYFVTDLDTYIGNSGSPVFNAQTHEVEGILVRGMPDLDYNEQSKCFRSRVCAQTADSQCHGEDVSRISAIQYLQK